MALTVLRFAGGEKLERCRRIVWLLSISCNCFVFISVDVDVHTMRFASAANH